MPRRNEPDGTTVDIDNYRMRHLRKLQGVSIAEFAAKVNVSYAYVSQIERGHKAPSPAVFVRICDALGIAADNRDTLMSPRVRRRLAAGAAA